MDFLPLLVVGRVAVRPGVIAKCFGIVEKLSFLRGRQFWWSAARKNHTGEAACSFLEGPVTYSGLTVSYASWRPSCSVFRTVGSPAGHF